MALEVTEGAVVGHHVEAVVGALEGPTRLVPPVGAVTDVGPHDRDAVVDRHGPDAPLDLVLGLVHVGVEHRRDELDLAVGVEVDEPDQRRRIGGRPLGEEAPGDVVHGVAGAAQVGAPGHAAVVEVDALEERRDHLAQLAQHEVGVGAGLGQRMGPHAQQQLLVALAGAVDADVRERRGRQDAAERVERLGPDGLAVDEVGVARGSSGTARGRSPASTAAARRRCRRGGPCRRRSGCRATTAARRGPGGSGSDHRCGRRRRCSGWTARGRP